MSDWRRQQCPKRGPGLSHAHSTQCDPDGVHPPDTTGNEGNKHPMNMCCHCQMTEELEKAQQATQAVAPRPNEEHEYRFTITGRCARCQRPEHEHMRVASVVPEGECAVDHRSLTIAMLIGDGGQEWRKCPRCQTHIEPKMAEGAPVGRRDGKGRGILLARQKERLNAVADKVLRLEALDEWEKTHAG